MTPHHSIVRTISIRLEVLSTVQLSLFNANKRADLLTMLDPLSAFNLAAGIVQFLDVSSKIISTATELYRSSMEPWPFMSSSLRQSQISILSVIVLQHEIHSLRSLLFKILSNYPSAMPRLFPDR